MRSGLRSRLRGLLALVVAPIFLSLACAAALPTDVEQLRDRRLLTLNEVTIKADARRYRERIIRSLGAKTVPEE